MACRLLKRIEKTTTVGNHGKSFLLVERAVCGYTSQRTDRGGKIFFPCNMLTTRLFSTVTFRLAPMLLVVACVQPLILHSLDGERLDGRWRQGREGSRVVQVSGADGEVLIGRLKPVPRKVFFENYQKTFGGGTIAADGPDFSMLGNAFVGFFGNSRSLTDAAYGENYNRASGKTVNVVKGPLFFWVGSLEGDRRTIMQCFLIGSSTTSHGLGRCKGRTGKEFTVEF